MTSIFSELLQSRSNSREDYLTACFAGLLKIWAEKDDQTFRDFIQWFSDKHSAGKLQEIITQRSAGNYGTPDLWIIFEDLLVLVENKWDAEPNPDQIKRYHDFLEEFRRDNPSIKTSLVFMNPLPQEVEWIKKPDQEITWFEISQRLEKVNEKRQDNGYSEFRFYQRQFLKFLEDYNMTDKPVSWQYIEGIPALLTLVNMIRIVLEELTKEKLVSNPSISFGSQWAGYYFFSPDGKNKFWFGQYFIGKEELEYLWFEIEELKTWKLPETSEDFEQETDYYNKIGRSFSFSEHYFFSRDALGQRGEIKSFIKETLSLFIKL